jgi:hypothetical protein
MTPPARSLVVNVLAAPILGTALAHRQVAAVLWRDIGGIPIVVYAFISCLIPVAVLTSVGNRICHSLASGPRRYSAWAWFAAGAAGGAVSGAVVVLIWRYLRGQSDGLLLAGSVTGAICGVAQAAQWHWGTGNKHDPAVA